MATAICNLVSPCDAPISPLAGDTEHAFNCLMSLAATYADHRRYPVAMECAWSAADTARAIRRPDLWCIAHDMLVLLRVALEHGEDGVRAFLARAAGGGL